VWEDKREGGDTVGEGEGEEQEGWGWMERSSTRLWRGSHQRDH